jgi:basic amino acid/polyamine antiporter, APA family
MATVDTELPGAVVSATKEVTAKQDVYVRQTSGLVRSVGPRTALLANLVGMGIIVNYFWIVYASAGYPNANLTTTVGIGVLINLGVAFVYWMLASTMPRSGGDYVFVGRIFHPSLGLATNLLFTVIFLTWAGYFAWYTASTAIPMMLASYTVAGGSGAALGAADWMVSSNFIIFWVGAAVLALVILASLLPTKWVFRVMVGIFAVSAIIYVAMLVILLTTSQATFASHWDAANASLAGQSYQNIIDSTSSTIGITFAGTFLGIVYTMLSFIGYANSAYYGGEIRGNPTRTQGLAIFGAPLIFAGLIAGLYAATYFTFGRPFIIGLSTGYVTGTISVPAFPSPLYLAAYVVPYPLFAAFLSFGLVITFFGFALIYFILPTRNLFAWSFDRIFPSFLTRVSRNGVPWVAILVLAVAAFICLWVGTYTVLLNYLSYANFGFWIAVAIVCLAGALFPFLRPQMFANAPSLVRARLGRVPILSIVGFASCGAALFVSYAASTASYVEPSGAYNYLYLAFLPIVFLVGFAVYWVARVIQKSRGVPVELISKELPPD